MVVQGSDCLFELNTGGGYLPFVCAKSFSISLNTETVEITSPEDGYYKDFDYDSLSYSIELSGLMQLTDDGNIRIFDLQELQMGFVEVLWRAIFEDADGATKVCMGTALITATGLNVQAGAMVDTPISLIGKGAYNLTDTTEVCEAEIGTGLFDISVSNDGGGVVTITINSVTGSPVRYDYTVDGGPVDSAFSNSWSVTGLADGPHTMLITPICANGVGGTVRTLDFSSAG